MGLKITTFRSRVTHSSDWARQAPLKMVLLGLGLESSGRFCFIPLPICYFFFFAPASSRVAFFHISLSHCYPSALLWFIPASVFRALPPHCMELGRGSQEKNVVCSFYKDIREKGRTRNLKEFAVCMCRFHFFYFPWTPYCHSFAS